MTRALLHVFGLERVLQKAEKREEVTTVPRSGRFRRSHSLAACTAMATLYFWWSPWMPRADESTKGVQTDREATCGSEVQDYRNLT